LRTPFYRGTDICLLTFAVNDIQSFKNVDSWKKEFLQYSKTTDVNFPFVVVATKVIKKKKLKMFALKNVFYHYHCFR